MKAEKIKEWLDENFTDSYLQHEGFGNVDFLSKGMVLEVLESFTHQTDAKEGEIEWVDIKCPRCKFEFHLRTNNRRKEIHKLRKRVKD